MKNIKKVLVFVLIAAFAVTAWGCGGGGAASDPKETVENYFACWSEKDGEGMYAILSEKAQETFTRDQIDAAYSGLKSLELISCEIVESGETDENTAYASIHYSIDWDGEEGGEDVAAMHKGEQYTSTVLSKVDGKWYMDIPLL